MLIITQKWILRQDLQSNPNLLYLFGDNLVREGMGGQAKEMRYEPNAFGIPTCNVPGPSAPNDFFADEPKYFQIIENTFRSLRKRLGQPCGFFWMGYQYNFDGIVVATDGLGTGIAQLPDHAPHCLALIERRVHELKRY